MRQIDTRCEIDRLRQLHSGSAAHKALQGCRAPEQRRSPAIRARQEIWISFSTTDVCECFQNDLLQGILQAAGDLGQRLFMLTLGRFLLLLAFLYGTAALGVVFVRHAGFSIALGLLCTGGIAVLAAGAAFYMARRKWNPVGDEATRRTCGAVQNNLVRAAVEEIARENGRSGIPPAVKNFVESLVAQGSHPSMIPVQSDSVHLTLFPRGVYFVQEKSDDADDRIRRRCVADDCSSILLRNRAFATARHVDSRTGSSPAHGVMLDAGNHRHTTGTCFSDDSVASRLRGIVSTVGKVTQSSRFARIASRLSADCGTF